MTTEDLDNLNSKITSVKFPHDFKGKVTDVTSERLKKAKATEMQLYLLHVLLPLLKPILDEELFVHHALFVTALQILNQDVCSQLDINNAQSLLDVYHRMNGIIYGRNFSTYTNHAITHLPHQRKLHGCPLVQMSNFVFEGYVIFAYFLGIYLKVELIFGVFEDLGQKCKIFQKQRSNNSQNDHNFPSSEKSAKLSSRKKISKLRTVKISSRKI